MPRTAARKLLTHCSVPKTVSSFWHQFGMFPLTVCMTTFEMPISDSTTYATGNSERNARRYQTAPSAVPVGWSMSSSVCDASDAVSSVE